MGYLRQQSERGGGCAGSPAVCARKARGVLLGGVGAITHNHPSREQCTFLQGSDMCAGEGRERRGGCVREEWGGVYLGAVEREGRCGCCGAGQRGRSLEKVGF